jgi:hypothetical protein
MVRAPKI